MYEFVSKNEDNKSAKGSNSVNKKNLINSRGRVLIDNRKGNIAIQRQVIQMITAEQSMANVDAYDKGKMVADYGLAAVQAAIKSGFHVRGHHSKDSSAAMHPQTRADLAALRAELRKRAGDDDGGAPSSSRSSGSIRSESHRDERRAQRAQEKQEDYQASQDGQPYVAPWNGGQSSWPK